MPSSESSETMSLMSVKTIASAIGLAILVTLSGSLGSFGNSSAGTALDQMQGHINDVCGKLSRAGGKIDLQNYVIKNDPNSAKKIIAVPLDGKGKKESAEVNCKIENNFKISSGTYTVKTYEVKSDDDKVEVISG